jgi:hypothetical protein
MECARMEADFTPETVTISKERSAEPYFATNPARD